jgi:transitional endoplasmic reticulum ATPase
VPNQQKYNREKKTLPSIQSAEFTDRVTKKNTQDTLAKLRQLGGAALTAENGIAYHNGKQVMLPEGMSLKNAAKLLAGLAASMEEVHNFTKVFRYRPFDGAYALQETLKEIFGTSGTGKTIHTMFGSQPPQYINVEVGPGAEVKVPWGHIDFPPFEGTFILGATNDPQYGMLFQVTCSAMKKYEPEIEGLWIALEDTLRRKSIYKGKAIVGVGRLTRDGIEMPSFIDPYAINPESVAYSDSVFESLRASVWGPIRTAELQRAANLKLNRKTLLYGQYGTGKSLAGALTARCAVNNGWTFIQTKVGDEDLDKVLKTAELYAPAVVFVEDIDTLVEADPKKLAEMLELFDGVSSKTKEVMVLMTSNHAGTLPKGLWRVGRIDSAVEIGSIDQDAIRRLITNSFEETEPYDGSVDHGVYEQMSKSLVTTDYRMPGGSQLADNVDFERVFEAMQGYEPAFIKGTFDLAKSNGVIRAESLNFKLTTDDFVIAANTLRNQHDAHTNAADRPAVDVVGKVFSDLVGESVSRTLAEHQVDLEDGDILVKQD